MFNRCRCITVLMTFALAGGVRAEDQPTAKLPLDQLLETPISTAAKYDQQLSSVAASVTVVTSEEIERYGWTSLAEVLQSIRGFFLTTDHEYTYVGVRGIGRPSDFNSRLLIMIDGHTVADSVMGSAPAGTNLGVDMSMVEKIEIVRGPGSALYGTHAMLAVINIITKGADAIDDFAATLSDGSHDTRRAAMRFGNTFSNGTKLTASAYLQESAGANVPFAGLGVSRGHDYEDVHRFAMTLQNQGLRLALSTQESRKGLPGGKYDSVFDGNTYVRNGQDLAVLDYKRSFGNKKLEARAYYDRDHGQGVYDYGDIGIDHSRAGNRGGEARLTWDIRPNHRVTGGVEYLSAEHAHYTYVVGDFFVHLHRPYSTTSMYAEYEGHFTPKLAVVAGVRRDDFSATADSTSPRAALLFTPNRSTTLKLLYGSAFRSPNVYEAYYSDSLTPWKAHPDLKPETIRTTELVWEQRLSPDLMLLSSVFRINASQLIDEQIEPVDQIAWYNNVGTLESTGAEMALHLRMRSGLWARFAASVNHTDSDGQPASNAPRYLLKGGISTSPWARWHGGLEGIYESRRTTRDGDTTDPFLLVNGTVTRQLGAHFRLGLTAHNLLDTRYSNPVGPELQPQSVQQDGRSLTLKLTYTH